MKATLVMASMLLAVGCVGGAGRGSGGGDDGSLDVIGGGSGGGGGGGGGVGGGGSYDACADAVFRYSNLTASCGYGQEMNEDEAAGLCADANTWSGCTTETSTAASCLDGESCETMGNCQWAMDALSACLEGGQAACRWVDDGECDEPEGTNLCGEGTDAADCAGGGGVVDGGDAGGGTCSWPNDGECDEPEGTGLCAEGTDAADCSGGGGDEGGCDPAYCSGLDCAGDFCCSYWCEAGTCQQSCSS